MAVATRPAQPGPIPVGTPVDAANAAAPLAAARVVTAANVPRAAAAPILGGVHSAISADGEILSVGSRVQTQWTRAYGGDDSWWAGAILTLHENGTATIIYDDGEEWTGRMNEIYALAGDEDESDNTSARGGAGGTGGGGLAAVAHPPPMMPETPRDRRD